jgi:hypothetical protein
MWSKIKMRFLSKNQACDDFIPHFAYFVNCLLFCGFDYVFWTMFTIRKSELCPGFVCLSQWGKTFKKIAGVFGAKSRAVNEFECIGKHKNQKRQIVKIIADVNDSFKKCLFRLPFRTSVLIDHFFWEFNKNSKKCRWFFGVEHWKRRHLYWRFYGSRM